MPVIQLKWSDEDTWKVRRELRPDETPAYALLWVKRSWIADKEKYKLKYDCEFRIL